MQHSNQFRLIGIIFVLIVLSCLSYLFYFKPHAAKPYQVTINAGITFQQMLKDLRANSHLQHTLKNDDAKTIMSNLGQKDKSPEGQFLPDTYSFKSGTTDSEILSKAYQKMQDKLAIIWASRSFNLPYKNPDQLLIAASIIEKEAMLDKERPIIAGVIINRLAKNMPLQMDVTTIYGLKKFDAKLRPADLDNNNPYNTNNRLGFPPTPIALPSESSLQAAAHPDNNDYLYFVSKGDKSHDFSVTGKEHKAAVEKYQH